jgi:hypothetical protein
MNEHDLQFYIREGEKLDHGTVEDFLVDHSTLIEKIRDVLHNWHMANPEGPFWKELIEPLAIKILVHSASLETLLFDKTALDRLTGPQTRIRDISSIYTIGRAQLEAYLTFFYLYIQPQSEDEFEMRYYLFVVHSLTVRQTVTVDLIPDDMKQQFTREAEQIIEYQDRIRQNPVFAAYSPQNKNRLINGTTAKEMGWEKILNASSLNNYMKKTYDMYANHAHSEYMSLLQVRTLFMKPEDAAFIFPTVIKTSLFILSVFLEDLIKLLDQKSTFDSFPLEFRRRVTLWRGIITSEQSA